MSVHELLSQLVKLDIKLWVDGERLRYNAPQGTMTPELQAQLVEHKAEIMARLKSSDNLGSPTTLAERPVHIPLSFAQQRLWFVDQLEPGSAAYNIFNAVRLRGPLDVDALEQGYKQTVQRHESLRTTFQTLDGQPQQVVAPSLEITLPMVDLSALPQPEQETETKRLSLEEAQRPFDLSGGPLVRCRLLRLSDSEHILLLTMHHIISDGWSMGVFFREIVLLGQAYAAGQVVPLPALSLQYPDFAIWQRGWLQGEVLETQMSYWKKQLEGASTALELPTDHARPAIQTYRGARLQIALPKELNDALQTLSHREDATLFMTLLAAFQVLLSRYSGQTDILVGSPVANRSRTELEGLIGCFVNDLVLRTDLTGNPSFLELLRRVRETCLGAFDHQDVPFEKLVEELHVARDLSRNPLFQVMFILQNAPMVIPNLFGLSVEVLETKPETAQFDLTLSLTETEHGLAGTLEYNTDLFEQETVARMAGHYQILLEAIIANPQQHLSELPLLSAAEKQQLLAAWNATRAEYPQESCIQELFEAQVKKTPEAVALVFEKEQLTYRELNERANQLAHYLRNHGVGPDKLVGICLERSLEMVVGLLGILKAGGAYVPLDPTFPKERLALMLSDSHLTILLTQAQLVAGLPEHQARLIRIDVDWVEIAKEKTGNPRRLNTPEHLAYVIYTSGSTGRPKGVQVLQGAVVNFLTSMCRAPGITAEDRLLSITTLSFDIAGLELYLPLIVGAQVEVLAREITVDGFQLRERLKSSGATIMQATPATWRLLLDAGWAESERIKVLCGGEALSPALCSDLLPRSTSLWNLYGPTETTVWSTLAHIETVDGTATIGRPIANTQVYILDAHLNPTPVGVPGELHIGGSGLARGYLNRPELTAEKFIPNPFLSYSTNGGNEGGGERLYRTGDLARWLPDGNLEYLGRIDHQVKVRGFRIELGEIESALGQHPDVREVVVLAREDTPGNPLLAGGLRLAGAGKRLVAYLVTHSQETPQPNALREFLMARLPDYMLPSTYIFLESLPLTPNGKVDRRALPSPEPGAGLTAGYVAPRSALEQIISQVWAEALQIEKVGANDNFFDLGGHSLLMARIHARLREQLQRDLKMVTLFQYPTVSALAGYLSAAEPEASAANAGSLRARLRRDLMKQPDDGVAVIGLAGRFPGAQDTDSFWQNLCAGKESVTFFSEDELRAAGLDEELLSNPNYIRAKPILENIEEFDAFFFGYNPREAALMDPQQRVFLESAWQALERAGYDSERYTGRIGVYASISANSYLLNNLLPAPGLVQSLGVFQTMLGNDKDFLTTRVSYKLNLKGPSFNVQTACSSSLVAIHLACQSLLRGESDMALAGGVSINVNQKSGYLYEPGGIASPDGHCRAFDAQAQGTLFGNGVGVVVLKRLGDALADGDTICAVIKGTAINNDGSIKVGFTAPSVDGQAQAIAEAQAMAGVRSEMITYIETHGTGTELGDPIEVAALTQAFGLSSDSQQTGFCAIGSVKTNIGHLDAAAGVAGFIKTVLALQHRQIPPSLHFERPNPTIDFEHSPFYVNAALAEWPAGPTPRRAGVSSFGIGGTNAHAVLEEAPPIFEENGEGKGGWQLLLLSAKTDTALNKATADLIGYLKKHPERNLADIAYTLQVGRHIFDQRRAVVCCDVDDAIAALENLDPKRASTVAQQQKDQGVVFMFPGGGGQYVGMGGELYLLEPVFREQIDRCAQFLEPHLGLDLRKVLYPPDDADSKLAAEQLGQIWLMQPALFVIEYALAQLWMSWGVKPQAMIGHSLGEYVAACLAGVFSLEDALAVMAARGRLMQSQPHGVMLAVALPEAEVEPMLGDGLSLAVVNGPAACVVAGRSDAAALLEERLVAQGVECTRLNISHASHSLMMDPILELFSVEVKRVKLNPPQIPFMSNLTGNWITAAEATDPAYWVRHLRQTVRFGNGLMQVLKESASPLIEVGAGRALTGLALNHPDRSPEQAVVLSLRHVQDTQSDQAFLLAALGKLWLAGGAVDWTAFHQGQRRQRVPLPTYPFERQRCWIEPQLGSQPGRRSLNGAANIADWFYVPLWKCSDLIAAEDHAPLLSPWLIFADGCGLGAQLAASLGQEGRPVITVQEGEGFAKLDDRLYTLNPGQAGDYEALFNDLRAQEKLPQRIIHLWNVTEHQEEFEQMQEKGFYSLLFLAQALGQHETPVRVAVISNGLQKINREESLSLGKSTLLGVVRTIPTEYAHIHCCSIDVDLAQPQPELVDLLAAELLAEPPELIVAYRDSCRWVQTFEPVRLGKVGQSPRLKPRGVYLVTGGLGGVGFTLARHMAQSVQARLALVGRSAMPAPEEWDAWLATHDEHENTSRRIRQVRELEALGAEVLVCAADVANVEQMQAVIDQILQRFGRLNGVVHAAGVPGGGIMQLKTREMVENIFAPKVKGTLVLAELLKARRLDFMVLCSSLTSVVGTPGQVDDSAANGFMDAFAHSGYSPGMPVIAINWSTWNEVGMAVETRKQGLGLQQNEPADGLDPWEGLQAFNRILAHGLPQALISKDDLAEKVAHSQVWNAGFVSGAAGQAVSVGTLHPRPQLKNPYTAPESEVEQALASIWQELLGIDRVGIHDNFFELGGHSLLATQVVSRLRQAFSSELSLRELFESPTVAELAQALQSTKKIQGSGFVPMPRPEEIPLSFEQQRLWLVDRLEPGTPINNVFTAVRMRGRLDIAVFERAFQYVVRRNECLHFHFQAVDGCEPHLVIDPDMPVNLSFTDLSEYAPAEREMEIQRLKREAVLYSFDLAKGPLIRCHLLHLGQDENIMLLTLHHSIIDGWSLGILIREVAIVYQAFVMGQPSPLPELTLQYIDYVLWERNRLESGALKTQMDYWKEQLAGLPDTLDLPGDYPRPARQKGMGCQQLVHLPRELSLAAQDLSRREGVTLYMILLAALQALLARYSDQTDIAVGSPIANRNQAEFESMIGFFINTLIMRTDLSGDPSFRELLQRVRKTCLGALEHPDIPYKKLMDELQVTQNMSRNPLFQTLFVLQDARFRGSSQSSGDLVLENLPNDTHTAQFDVYLTLEETESGLDGYFVYDTGLFEQETMITLTNWYRQILEDWLANPERRLSEICLPEALTAKAEAVRASKRS